MGRAVALVGFLDQRIPLLDKQLKVLTDIRLELKDGLGGESVRYELSLAGVLLPVPGVEQPSSDRDERIVEVANSHIRKRIKESNANIFWETHDFRKPLPWP